MSGNGLVAKPIDHVDQTVVGGVQSGLIGVGGADGSAGSGSLGASGGVIVIHPLNATAGSKTTRQKVMNKVLRFTLLIVIYNYSILPNC